MARVRRLRSLQIFAGAVSSAHNRFKHDRSLKRRRRFKSLCDTALAERRELLGV